MSHRPSTSRPEEAPYYVGLAGCGGTGRPPREPPGLVRHNGVMSPTRAEGDTVQRNRSDGESWGIQNCRRRPLGCGQRASANEDYRTNTTRTYRTNPCRFRVALRSFPQPNPQTSQIFGPSQGCLQKFAGSKRYQPLNNLPRGIRECMRTLGGNGRHGPPETFMFVVVMSRVFCQFGTPVWLASVHAILPCFSSAGVAKRVFSS